MSKSKIDLLFHLHLFNAIGIVCLIGRHGIREWRVSVLIAAVVFGLGILLFLLPVCLHTYYRLEETALFIRSGLFVKKRIPYRNVQSISDSKDAVFSTLLSNNCIRVEYINEQGESDELYISPQNKYEFFRCLDNILRTRVITTQPTTKR